MADEKKRTRQSLSDDSIQSRWGLSRRSLLLGSFAAATDAGVGTAEAATDRDAGYYADPAGRGYTGLTDSDGGSNADRAGHGRRRRTGGSGITDNDNGSYRDPAGRGRGSTPNYNTGITDRDNGSVSDPGGRGRGGT